MCDPATGSPSTTLNSLLLKLAMLAHLQGAPTHITCLVG
jgi:hypothetical protein